MRKIIQFFRDVRAEMGKVIWPSRKDLVRYTVTVIVFSIVMAVVLGAADFGLLKGIQTLIKDQSPSTEQTEPQPTEAPAEQTQESSTTETPTDPAQQTAPAAQ